MFSICICGRLKLPKFSVQEQWTVFFFLNIINNKISIINIIDSGSSLYASFTIIRFLFWYITCFVLSDCNALINSLHTSFFCRGKYLLVPDYFNLAHNLKNVSCELICFSYFFPYKAIALLGAQFENPSCKVFWMPNKDNTFWAKITWLLQIN